MSKSLKVPIEDVTVSGFEPFGWTAGPQTKWTPMEEAQLYKCWANITQINFKNGGDVRIYEFKKRAFSFDWLERHLNTYEILIPYDGNPSVIGVAKPRDPQDPDDLPHGEDVKLFFWDGKDTLILNKGIWHTAPFPITEKITYLVIVENGTPTEDMIQKNIKDETIIEPIFPV